MTITSLPRYRVRRCRCPQCWHKRLKIWLRDEPVYRVETQCKRNATWRLASNEDFFNTYEDALQRAIYRGNISRLAAERQQAIEDTYIVRSYD